jgi:hypothetical protein
MEDILNSIGTRIYTRAKHTGYTIKFKQLKTLVKKWSKNRNPDMSRVSDMYEYHQRGGYIPLILHLADLQAEGLVCYDGNHRRELLQTMNDDSDCIIDVLFAATVDDVFESFEGINKAIDVPDIFLDDSMNIKDDVLSLVKKFENLYSPFTSKTSKCRAPHFNRDVLTNNITNIYT